MARKNGNSTPSNGEMKTYIMKLMHKDDLRKITVPKHWRVTFGPLVPGKEGRGNAALRFYDGEDQRACFVDVESFRDESIKIEERVTRVKQQAVNKKTPNGEKQVIVEARVTEWRNPDAPEDAEKQDEEFLGLEDMR